MTRVSGPSQPARNDSATPPKPATVPTTAPAAAPEAPKKWDATATAAKAKPPVPTATAPVIPSAASAVAAAAPVTKKTAAQLGTDEQATLRSWMHRGDAPRELRGTKLINELGTALLFQPNHEPKTPGEEAQINSGNWAFFQGKQLSAIDTVKSSIVKLSGGSEPVNVAALPLLLTDPKSKTSVQLPLFRVDDSAGKTLGFVDNLGRQYKTLDQWKTQNKLPAGELTYPANGHLTEGADGLPNTITEASHATIDTTMEHVASWAEKIGTVAGFVVGGAALIGVGGIAIPIAGAALAIGFGGKAVMGLVDAEQHGQTINPIKSSEARSNWLTAAASIAGLGSSAATMAAVKEVAAAGQITGALGKLAPELTVGAQAFGTAQTVDGSVSLVKHWNEMAWKDRMYATAQLAFFGATTGHAAKQAGGLKNLYSVDAVKLQLGFPVEAKAVEKAPSLLSDRTTVKGNLDKRDFFGEVSNTTGAAKTTAQLVNTRTLTELNTPGEGMFSGKTGRLQAARFVNRNSRLDGDFRLAYGEQAFKAWASADAHLNAIPKGKLAENLSLDLLKEVNTLGYVPGEDSGLAKVGHAMRAAQGNAVKGGALRDYESRSLPFKMKPEDVHNIRANGADVSTLHVGDVGEYALVYPDHTQIEPKLNALIASTKTALNDPNSDVVKVAAEFSQKFVSMHPFQDGNGRTARLVMDRILAERDVPPPIFKDTGDDVTLSAAAYESEVRAGIDRMSNAASGSGSRLSPNGYFKEMARDVKLAAPENNKLLVGGEPFVQGPDGFVYNSAGRPHTMNEKGELAPMSQLEHFAIARRAHQAKDPVAMMTAYTETTRKAFDAATKAAPGKSGVTVATELPAIAADNQFVMSLKKTGNDALVGLYDLKNTANLDALLTHSSPSSTTKSFVISKHNQLDLEMWHVQKNLTAAGDTQGAAKIMQYREDLFGLAKEKLASMKGEAPTNADNPLAFEKKFEQLAYEESPLSFPTLKDAIKARGDDTVRVWRGDVVMSSTIGMHPDYSPMNPDAFQLASMRAAKNGTASIVGDLAQVAGSSLGTGYLCYTTDLKLLNSSNGFAEKFNPLTLSLEALPAPIKDRLTRALTVDEKAGTSKTFSIDSFRDLVGIASGRKPAPKGSLDVSGVAPEVFEQIVRAQMPAEDAATLVKRYTEAFDKANSSPMARLQNMLTDAPVLVDVSDVAGMQGYKANSVLESLGKARDVVQLELNGDKLNVRTARRAFLVEMNKTDAMPGIGTLGGRSFENEQEVTGLGKVAPWRILKAYKRSELDLDLPKPPAKPAAAAEATPATPAPSAAKAAATNVAVSDANAQSNTPDAPTGDGVDLAKPKPKPGAATAGKAAATNVAVSDANAADAPDAHVDTPDAPIKSKLKLQTIKVGTGEHLKNVAKRMVALAKTGVEVNAKFGSVTLVAKPGDSVEMITSQVPPGP